MFRTEILSLLTDLSLDVLYSEFFFLLLQIVLWMFWTKELFFPPTDLSLDLQDKDFSSLIDLSQMDVQEKENFAPVIDLSLDVQEKKQSLNLIPPLL
jgi:hypothetical protein